MRMAGCRPRNAGQVPPPAPHITGKDMRPAAPASGNFAMFEKRTYLVRFLAVAETDRRRNGPTSPSRRSPSQAAPGGPSRAGAVSGCPSASDDACRPRIPIGLHFNGRPCVLARPTLPKASSIAMPYAVRLNPDPPAGRTGSDGLKFRMATSGIRAGALLCRSGTAWVSDRIQTRVYRRRPLSGLEEHDAKSQEHPNDKRSLVTHTLDDGRSSQAGALTFVDASDTTIDCALGATTWITNSRSAEEAPTTRPCPRRPQVPTPTRFGRQRYQTVIVARCSAENLAPFRALKSVAHGATQGHSGRSTE